MTDSQDQDTQDKHDKKSDSDERSSRPASDAGTETAAEPVPELPPPTPEERVVALEAEKAELRDRMLRIAADFENWKKRSRKELSDGEARVKEQVLRDFLEIIDNLERATLSWQPGKEEGAQIDAKAIRDGVDLVLRQFRSKLERYQVKVVEAKGAAFDPRFHEAISQVPASDAKPGSVVHELQKGYMIGERLLRPAMVVVAAAPASPSPAATEKAADATTSAPSDKSSD
jgi:molecular chaperone GrpE